MTNDLREIRRMSGLKPEVMASRMGVSIGTYYRMENRQDTNNIIDHFIIDAFTMELAIKENNLELVTDRSKNMMVTIFLMDREL